MNKRFLVSDENGEMYETDGQLGPVAVYESKSNAPLCVIATAGGGTPCKVSSAPSINKLSTIRFVAIRFAERNVRS